MKRATLQTREAARRRARYRALNRRAAAERKIWDECERIAGDSWKNREAFQALYVPAMQALRDDFSTEKWGYEETAGDPYAALLKKLADKRTKRV